MATINFITDDKKWQAQSDARILAEYQSIMADSKRKSAAMKEAKRQAEELSKKADAMRLAMGDRLKK